MRRLEGDEGLDVRVLCRSPGNHRATVRVADDDYRTRLCIDDTLRRFHIAGKGGESILDCDHVVAVALKDWNYVLPACSIGERAVNEHDRRLGGIPGASSFCPRARSPVRHKRGLGTKDAYADEAGDDHADERESDDAGHDLSTQKAMPVDLFEHFCLPPLRNKSS